MWQEDLWQAASLDGRLAMLELDESEPTYLAGTVLGRSEYVDGLTRSEATELVAHSMSIAMERLGTSMVVRPEQHLPPSRIIHCFLTPAWIRDLPATGPHTVHGQLDGKVAGFVRYKRGRHSEWSSELGEVDLAEVTTDASVTTVWRWPAPKNLADLTFIEQSWHTKRMAPGDQTR